jgi:ribonuclease P/MRP protein subunit POP3
MRLNGALLSELYHRVELNAHVRPVLPHNTQTGIVAHVVKLLAGVCEYNVGRRLQSRKRKRASRSASSDMAKRRRLVPDVSLGDKRNPLASEWGPVAADDMRPSSSIPLVPPAVYAHLSVGINEVTKALELLAMQARPRRIPDSSEADTSQAAVHSRVPVQVVLVCLHDLDSPAMIAHLPQLVAACNSARRLSATDRHQPVKLVPLPKGTEGTLANALGLRHASALAFDVSLDWNATLFSLKRILGRYSLDY